MTLSAVTETTPVSMFSPFGGGMSATAAPAHEQTLAEAAVASLASPFAEAMTEGRQVDERADVTATLAAELEDESFEEAVQALVDEAAGRHLAAAGAFAPGAAVAGLAAGEAEAWMAGLAAEADGVLARFESQFADRPALSLAEGELEATLTAMYPQQGEGADPFSATREFLGGLVRKVGKLARGAVAIAKKGIGALAKFLPVGQIFGLIRKLVTPLLRRVLRLALNRIPAALRPAADALAKKVLGESQEEAGADETGAGLAEAFDAQLAQLASAENTAALDRLVAEAEADSELGAEAEDRLAALDAARAALAEALAEAPPGEAPTAAVQQFVPVVMAALPAIRLGIGVIGRGKVVNFLAARLADLIRGQVGPEATGALSRAIADAGLRMLSLEAEAAEAYGVEALVSTLEDTVRAVAELPAESLAEPLRMDAEILAAFTEAAARHLPRSVLREDLDGHEAEDEGGTWVLMPRRTRPCHRYRKYSRVYPVQVGQAVARSVVLRDGETLEEHLLDAGVGGWPVTAEVHLYETLPGAHLGHLAAFETESTHAEALAAPAAGTDEFEDLTPEAAGLLLGRPRLGRAPQQAVSAGGRRLYRIVVPGAPARRRRNPRFVVRLSTTGTTASLRVHLRLGEREAHSLAGMLATGAHVGVVALLRRTLTGFGRQALAQRLVRRSGRALGTPLTRAQADALAAAASERMLTAVAAQLPAAAATLAAAAKDPARGVTLTFDLPFADRAALVAGKPGEPTLAIRPGPRRD